MDYLNPYEFERLKFSWKTTQEALLITFSKIQFQLMVAGFGFVFVKGTT